LRLKVRAGYLNCRFETPAIEESQCFPIFSLTHSNPLYICFQLFWGNSTGQSGGAASPLYGEKSMILGSSVEVPGGSLRPDSLILGRSMRCRWWLLPWFDSGISPRNFQAHYPEFDAVFSLMTVVSGPFPEIDFFNRNFQGTIHWKMVMNAIVC